MMQKDKDDSALYEIWSDGLTKVYGKKKKAFKAVKSINLRVEPGIHGFLGPNGAGKTTTINMLVGALSISGGRAKIRDEQAGSIEARRLIGFLPQDPVFYMNMTGEEYLIYMGKLNGLSSKEARRKGQQLTQYFDIFNDRNRKISEYSGGMKQKIGIAAALIHDPKVLILDEPTANLDPIGRANIIEKIKEISKSVSVFVSSHILSEIEMMCEKVTMINNGKIVISDTIKNIKKNYTGNVYVLDTDKNVIMVKVIEEKEYVWKAWIDDEDGKVHIIPQDPMRLQQEIAKTVLDNGATLFGFYQPELSLQDIFMEIMAKKDGGDADGE